MAVKRKYRLNLMNYGNLPAIMLSQYDEGYALEFEIRDGTEAASDLSAYTVTLKGTRADTLAYSFAGTISTNVLTFVIDTTMTACAGRGTAEIAIKDTANDVLFATFNMPVFVERAAVPEGSIDADVERAQEIAEQIQEIVDNAAAEVKGEAESWAVGQRDGTDVPATDPTYHNNAKYYSEQAQQAADSIGIDATLTQAGKAADAKKTGDEINELKEELSYEAIASNQKENVVNLYGVNGAYTSYAASADVRRFNNLFFVNGTIVSENTRFALTGTELSYRASSPTYDRAPNWYVADGVLADFVVGHTYKMHIKLLSGDASFVEETGSVFFTWRTTDQSLNESHSDGYEWLCNKVPNMVCFVFKRGTFTNCVYNLEIEDITAAETGDPLAGRMTSAEESIAALDDRVDEIEGKSDTRYTYPSFFESQLITAIAKINTDMNSDKTAGTYGTDVEPFVFITDVHWAENKKHSPGLIKQILDNTPVQTVICGGDFIHSSNATKAGAAKEIRDFNSLITEIPCYEYFCVFGNHDSNSNSEATIDVQFTKAEQYNLLYSPFANMSNVHWIWEDVPNIMAAEPVKNDYYVDHARTRTRYLCLDWNNPMSGDRAAWITSVLAKDDGYRVVVIYHGIYAVSGGVLTPEHTTIMSLVEPYKSKVVALFTGHAHMDDVVDYFDDGSVPVIITSCDTFRAERMTEGTLDEQCFDVAVIDYGQSKIKLTRIGRGTDREITISLA